MNAPRDHHPELAPLVVAVIEQTITEAQWTRLVNLLKRDVSARDAYLRLMSLHGQLCVRYSHRVGVQGSRFDQWVRGSRFRVQERVRSWEFGMRSWIAAAAAALVALVITAWFMRPITSETPLSELRTPQSPPIAMLSDVSHDAVFVEANGPMTIGGSLPPGPVRLTCGKAQIMFDSTAVVDLIGPCEFEMTGPNRGRLASGELEAYVPKHAAGFTVELPGGARVVDLGTRFAVVTDPSGRGVVGVREGVVRLEQDGLPDLNLSAGQIARIQPGRPFFLDDDRRMHRFASPADYQVLVRYHDGSASIAPIQPVDYIQADDATFTGESWRTAWGDAGPTPPGAVAGSAPGSNWRMFRCLSTPSTPTPRNQYLGFSLQYTGNQRLDLSTLEFDWVVARNATQGGVSFQWAVFASLNGRPFTRVDARALIQALPATVGSAFSEVTTAVADLSAIAPLAPGDRLEIRIGVADDLSDYPSNSKAAFMQGLRLKGRQTFMDSLEDDDRVSIRALTPSSTRHDAASTTLGV